MQQTGMKKSINRTEVRTQRSFIKYVNMLVLEGPSWSKGEEGAA